MVSQNQKGSKVIKTMKLLYECGDNELDTIQKRNLLIFFIS